MSILQECIRVAY